MILLFLVAQAVTPVAMAAPLKVSILQPVADEPCVRPSRRGQDSDIVVCGRPLPSRQFPIHQRAGRAGANPDTNGFGAMNLAVPSPTGTLLP